MLIALLSFVAGLLSVLAPCILPLLPIIIGGSLTDKMDKKRPYIIAASLVTSLLVFTILLKVSTSLIGINPNVWSYISGFIIVALGLAMLFPYKWDFFIVKIGIQSKSQKLLGRAGNQKNRTMSAVLTGAALGPVFSSCSPMYAWVIATVLPESTARGLFYLLFYVAGLALSLLGISLIGRNILDKIKWASNPRGLFQRIIAILFIFVGLIVATGYYKNIQSYLVDKDLFNLKTLEEKLIPDDEPQNPSSSNFAPKATNNTYFNVAPYAAPELTGLQEWINSKPLTLASLKGRVVLIDFWTYSCINCERTLPYVQGWYDSYKDNGFVVLGLHAPEFAFEKVPKNVIKAVDDRSLTYPVALDNNFATWRAYKNRYWPAIYLIDRDGMVRRTHFGEGNYEKTEEAIRELLAESGSDNLVDSIIEYKPTPISSGQTHETYISSSRAERFTNELTTGEGIYSVSGEQPTHTWSLGGKWDIGEESSRCISSCMLQITYKARHVYAVFSGVGDVEIKDRTITTNNDIHTLVENNQVVEETVIIKLSPGLSIHALTFGS